MAQEQNWKETSFFFFFLNLKKKPKGENIHKKIEQNVNKRQEEKNV